MLASHINRKTVGAILGLLCAILLGCAGEPEATFVDFSQRMTVERPGDQPSNSLAFRVAVGSMISAQETAVHYHQLLDYIAEKLGREIQLVQHRQHKQPVSKIG